MSIYAQTILRSHYIKAHNNRLGGALLRRIVANFIKGGVKPACFSGGIYATAETVANIYYLFVQYLFNHIVFQTGSPHALAVGRCHILIFDQNRIICKIPPYIYRIGKIYFESYIFHLYCNCYQATYPIPCFHSNRLEGLMML